MASKNIKVTTLGQILGVRSNTARQAGGERFYTFMKNLAKERIYRDNLQKIADYFDLPLDYFILSDRDFAALHENRLAQTVRPTTEGTYLFIHRDDHELIRPVLEKMIRA